MVQMLKTALVGAIAFAAAGVMAQIKQDCGIGFGSCPESKPCCSQYGQCGIGAFCLGGCDPKFSTTLDSCVAAPVCKSKTHTFAGLKTIADKTKYLGDSSKFDWVVDGKVRNQGDNLLLTMEPNSVGTVLASTTYVLYGKVSAKLKTSRGAGVVSALIFLSDMKDEIDFEWIGVDLETTQTNYYWQGFPDYTKGGNISTPATFDEWHTYAIEWTPEEVIWSVDDVVGRTLKKSDTYNETTKHYQFPQTPSRVQLSLWPGGLASNAPGTIEWAGGEIDWENHADIKDPGYYYVAVESVNVECYDAPDVVVKKGTKSYTYNDKAGYLENVVITDKPTVLKSMVATGTNMTAVEYVKPSKPSKPKASASATANADADDEEEDEDVEVETVPGLTSAGTGANNHANGESSNTVVVGGSSISDNGDVTSDDDQSIVVEDSASTDDSSAEFTQGDGTPTDTSGVEGRVMQGSMLAIVVAVAVMLVL